MSRNGLAPRVKICGITRDADVPVLNETLPDYVGFVFASASRRRVGLPTAVRLRALLDRRIATVGVFVDQPVAEVAAAVDAGAICIAQLHGNEDADYLAALRGAVPSVRIIKAVAVRDAEAIVAAGALGADALLLDNVRGGSGRRFDWALVAAARELADRRDLELPPFFLAGGLDPGNVAAAVASVSVRPYGVDVSSGVETDGRKDEAKVRAFVAAARSGSPTAPGPSINSSKVAPTRRDE